MKNDLNVIRQELNRTHPNPNFVEKFHGSECIALAEQLGLAASDQLLVLLSDKKYTGRENKFHDLLTRILLAKMASLEGNLKFSQTLFLKVYQRAGLLNRESARENGAAYLEYEYSEMLARAGDISRSQVHLERALSLARSNKFKHLLEYQAMKSESWTTRRLQLRSWLQHIAYFSKYEMHCMVVQAHYDLARVYLRLGDTREAASYLEAAHASAIELGYRYLAGRIDISRGEVLLQQERINEAMQYFKSLSARIESPQLRVRVMDHIIDLYAAQGETEKALELGMEAVEASQRFNMLQETAALSTLVGRLYHRTLKDITKSFFYLQKAYGAVQDMLNLGFGIQGDNAEFIGQYVSFLEEHFPGEVEEAANEDLFAFSKGLTWVRIKDLFHYNLFLYHYMNTGVGLKTLEVLDFPASSFYSATERLRSRGITFPNFRKNEVEIPSENYVEGLQQYCRLHREQNWVDINDQFEKDMLAYQYKVNNYNKKLMAKQLDLAYSGIVNRTQYLTSGKK